MRIGLFGGAFDPIHAGHVAPVQAARRALGLDRVLYLPTAHPPHKADRDLVAPHHRYTMVELALLDEPGLFASPFEMRATGPSYTIDTVEHFRRLLVDEELFLVVGADAWNGLPSWRRWRDLVDAVELVVLARPGWDAIAASLDPALQALARSGRVHVVANDPVEVSSTVLRAMLAAGQAPPPGSMARRVLDYAAKYALYRARPDALALSIV